MHCFIPLICTALLVDSSIAVLVHDPNLNTAIIDAVAKSIKKYQKENKLVQTKFEEIQDDETDKLAKYFETFAIAERMPLRLPNIHTLDKDGIYYLCHFIFFVKKIGGLPRYISLVENGKHVLPTLENYAEYTKLRFSKNLQDLKPKNLAKIACKAAEKFLKAHFKQQVEVEGRQYLKLGFVYDTNTYNISEPRPDDLECGQGLLVMKFPDDKLTAGVTVDSEESNSELPVITLSKKEKRQNLPKTEEPETEEIEQNQESEPMLSTNDISKKESSLKHESILVSLFKWKKVKSGNISMSSQK